MDKWADANRDHHDAEAGHYEDTIRPDWMPPSVFAFKADVQPFLDALPRDTPIADLGCGTGDFCGEAISMGFLDVTGIDISPNMLGELTSHFPRAITKCADVTDLPCADGQFGFVNMKGCLHHVSDTAAALSEVRRVLRPGGLFRLQEPNADSFLNGDAGEDGLERPLSLRAVRRRLDALGFEILLAKTYLHFGAVDQLRQAGVGLDEIDALLPKMNLLVGHAGEIFLIVCRQADA